MNLVRANTAPGLGRRIKEHLTRGPHGLFKRGPLGHPRRLISTSGREVLAGDVGEIIGNFDTRVSAAFDGITSQVIAACAQKTSGVSQSNVPLATLGKNWLSAGGAKVISRVAVYGPSNDWVNSVNDVNSGFGILLYGTNEGAASGGVPLGSAFNGNNGNVAGTMITFAVTDAALLRPFHSHYIGVQGFGSWTSTVSLAEVQFWQLVG